MKAIKYKCDYMKKDLDGLLKKVGSTEFFVYDESQSVAKRAFLSAPNQECKGAHKLVIERVN